MNPYRRTWPRVAALALTVSLVAACGSGGDSGDSGTGPAPIRIAYQQSAILSLMDWVAKDQGFFEQRGLDASLVPNSTGANAVASALRGEVDILYGPQANTIEATKQGECFKYLTSGHRNSVNIIARKGLPMPSKKSDAFPGGIADLKGLKFGVPNLGSATDRNARTVLAAGGLDVSKDVTFIAVGVGATAIAALEKGSVDAMVAFPPASESIAASSYDMVVDLVKFPENSPVKDVIISHDIATCDYVQQHPDRVANYCKAWYDARDWTQDSKNDDAVALVLAKYLSLAPDVAKAMWLKYKPVWAAEPYLTKDLWAAQSKFNAAGSQDVPPYDQWVYEPCANKDPRV